MPGSDIFERSGAKPRPYEPTKVHIHRAVSEPVKTTMFLPDHASLVTNRYGDQFLIQESLWHSELFYSDYFRCDVSTSWQFRTNNAWMTHAVVGGVVANCYHRYWFNYFHWVMDALPKVWAISKSSKNPDIRWFVGPVELPYQQPLLDLFSVDSSNIIEYESQKIIEFEGAIHATFRFDEPLKTVRPDFNYGTYNTCWSKEYFTDLRILASKAYAEAGPSYGERLYINRGNSAHRRITNHDDVFKVLMDRGFRSIDPGSLPMAEQIAAFQDAKWIVGAHGAGLTNMLWSKPGARVLEFMPETLDDIGYSFMAPLCGHVHSAIICPAVDHDQGIAYADITVDISLLNQALDRLL